MKLILLTGFAGIGKSTIARKYIAEHPLVMAIEGDHILDMIGCWTQDESKARELKLKHIKALIQTHLQAGYDVILPYLITDASHAEQFEAIAKENRAQLHEVSLMVEKEDAVARLLERGRWGEAGLKPLTEADRPRIDKLYDMMVDEVEKRPNMVHIRVQKGDIGGTYTNFLEVIR